MDPAGILEALSRTFLDSALDCVITMDASGRVQESNPASERVFGFTRSEAVGKELAELIVPPKLRERHRQGLAHYLKTREGPLIGKLIEIEALRRKANEGTLSPDEEVSYKECVEALDVMSIIQSKARRFLADHSREHEQPHA